MPTTGTRRPRVRQLDESGARQAHRSTGGNRFGGRHGRRRVTKGIEPGSIRAKARFRGSHDPSGFALPPLRLDTLEVRQAVLEELAD